MTSSHEKRSLSTRLALECAARQLFAEHGFTAVSADQIVAVAGVTRGALQYQYGDKRGLFIVVLEQLERENSEEISAATAAANTDDPIVLIEIALKTFLDICLRPEMVRIALSDGPAVLGRQTWREFEIRHGLGLVIPPLEAARAAGRLADVDIPVLAQLLLSAITEAGMVVASAPDPVTAGEHALRALMAIVSGVVRGDRVSTPADTLGAAQPIR
ncbi:TetR/AcrR family transcriptional regulator [Nocardia sp. 2]|uniref:TetR/AcrR family transcriptional regulator n=1 Tax=Nocardia acididurans TaxID=2802282 RepID=A0ABS1MDX7_9NOCA|nr:TetR/AcrR family transcriptional regulator [Nocardia acididurans]MBL1078827.1 TetR/AcrR family transcriptional regulator [Nocardia acididurans]